MIQGCMETNILQHQPAGPVAKRIQNRNRVKHAVFSGKHVYRCRPDRNFLCEIKSTGQAEVKFGGHWLSGQG